jgi:hypothetical protein
VEDLAMLKFGSVTGFTVQTPSGKPIVAHANATRGKAIESYVSYLLDHKYIRERKEWVGDKWYMKYWRVLKRSGFRTVKVEVVVRESKLHGYKWPECREVTK